MLQLSYTIEFYNCTFMKQFDGYPSRSVALMTEILPIYRQKHPSR